GRRLFQVADERAADDDAVGHVAQQAHLFRLADAEADADGQVCLLAQPGDLAEQLLGQVLTGAGDAGHADVIEETGRLTGDLYRPLARRGRSDELYELEIACPSQAGQRLGFLDGQVRHDRSAEPRRLR